MATAICQTDHKANSVYCKMNKRMRSKAVLILFPLQCCLFPIVALDALLLSPSPMFWSLKKDDTGKT